MLKRTEGTGVFLALSGLDEDYVILWGEMEARIHEFESPLSVAKFSKIRRAVQWLGEIIWLSERISLLVTRSL